MPDFAPILGSLLLREFAAERDEVLRHKWLESEKANRDIGFEKALIHWIMWHRSGWLNHRRQLARVESDPRSENYPS